MYQYNYQRAAEEHQEAMLVSDDSWISQRVKELLSVITDETAKNFFVLQFSGHNLHLIGCDAFDTIKDDLNEVIYKYCLAMATAERHQIKKEEWLYN
ncbi:MULTISPECIES: hypothetical protein [Yersinia]|uniref:hypothetical protein n=1 Tax=Yersinia TaxID=629 RepID=UPI00119E55B1|nr:MULTISPECIES: hypothetical protein [Yersinia]QKJ16192.1 hypothetical protein HRD70_13980 [Yersinia kristensenii]